MWYIFRLVYTLKTQVWIWNKLLSLLYHQKCLTWIFGYRFAGYFFAKRDTNEYQSEKNSNKHNKLYRNTEGINFECVIILIEKALLKFLPHWYTPVLTLSVYSCTPFFRSFHHDEVWIIFRSWISGGYFHFTKTSAFIFETRETY